MSQPSANWFMDSGATHHLALALSNLNSTFVYPGNNKVMVGNGDLLSVHHIGSKTFKTNPKPILLNHVLHTPQIMKNLISISKLCANNDATVEFNSNFFIVKDRQTGRPLLQGTLDRRLYKLSS
ncbi:RNA-directed DNA polymerase [Bertholletia excelsa]